ncbi:MAG: hypothetical protein A3K65_00705 [Euryarchaeota archaeon RBG_16_68_12]|nr:MAG: hypothetical protein A3K65_00705 [Euryarchaeota archaeon RBG_16_68_12]
MNARLRAALLAALLVAVPSLVLPAPAAQAAGQLQTFLTLLQWPIALAFSPTYATDGRLYFAERFTGSVRVVENGTLRAAAFYALPGTVAAGERGLLGLALDPGFPSPGNLWVYAYQTYNDVANGTIYNRVVRILSDPSGNTGLSFSVILRMPPLSGATNHNGGIIGFGPDGKLYAVVGENANPALSQTPGSPMGKVLRMNPDGSPPADNPFYGSGTWDNLVYAYGHRNMFGLAFHPLTGRAYVTENGPACNDEVNLLVPGGNFGWGPSQTCTTPPPAPNNTNQDGPAPVLPLVWYTPTIAPTGATVLGGPFFPAWRGDLVFGDYNTRTLRRLDLAPPNYDVVLGQQAILTLPSGILDVRMGPDGAIWITTANTIYRYVDTGRPPVASFTAVPSPVNPAVPVAFDASASTDPDGTIVSYAWDFGDSATGSGVTTTHAYAATGTYTVALVVTDDLGLTNRSTASVLVRNPRAPVASFTATPSPVNPGALVTFNGSASFDPDGTIVSYAWDFGDSSGGTGITATHAYAASGRYPAVLLVVDNDSLSSTATRDVVVNAVPRAAISYSPTAIYKGVVVTFNGSGSTDPDGTIVSFAWDFGDGATGTGREATHAYARKGAFTVALVVTDDLGLTNRSTAPALVGNRPPAITSSDPAPASVALDPGQTRTFAVVAMDPDDDVLTYTWRVNGLARGGNTSSLDVSEPVAGVYTVNVTVTDGSLSAWHEWTVTVGTAGPGGASPFLWAAVALLAILVLAALLLAVWRRRRRKEQAPPPP